MKRQVASHPAYAITSGSPAGLLHTPLGVYVYAWLAIAIVVILIGVITGEAPAEDSAPAAPNGTNVRCLATREGCRQGYPRTRSYMARTDW